ncbi:Integrase core domain protein [Stieleria neptunia]|uniref:Integrase core domain protein n=1 Tax=Stieleria neptunia TaxID=2527979 RepID=A0A518HIH0_9BACT|nr:Integrase core domain protein [Stieleria neptunia]
MKEHVFKRNARDGHVQCVHDGEVTRSNPSRMMDLREDHCFVWTFCTAPQSDSTFEGSSSGVWVDAWIAVLQPLEKGLGLQSRFGLKPDLHLVPDIGEWIDASPVISRLLPLRGEPIVVSTHCLNNSDTERWWLPQQKDTQIVGGAMEMQAKAALIDSIRSRYYGARKRDKSRILDEFVAITGHQRKYALRILAERQNTTPERCEVVGRKIYDCAVKEVLVTLWESSDRLCGKRLKAILPELLKSMESHGHMNLDDSLKTRVLSASASTIDRLLRPIREEATGKKRVRPKKKVRAAVAVKTFSEWDDVAPGSLEVDFVAHCGGNLSGPFIHSLVATDVASGWTECIPILIREQSLVVESLELLRNRFPFPVLGINTDNDSSFINESVIKFCDSQSITFTRSRPYRKNDQAWIEQKNGSIVRKHLGYQRFSGPIACQTIAHLFDSVRWYVNMFQPSFKLLSKTRDGARVSKKFHSPQTPCERLLSDSRVSSESKEYLRRNRLEQDPLELLHAIRQSQAALDSLSTEDSLSQEQQIDLEEFLSQLPELWKKGEARPTHQPKPMRTRDYRTRPDPFEGDWTTILGWLEKSPDATASSLLERLIERSPDKYNGGQLRTLQRRVSQWRNIMARKLVTGTTAT